MKYAEIERFCLSLPGATLSIQWGSDHVYIMLYTNPNRRFISAPIETRTSPAVVKYIRGMEARG